MALLLGFTVLTLGDDHFGIRGKKKNNTANGAKDKQQIHDPRIYINSNYSKMVDHTTTRDCLPNNHSVLSDEFPYWDPTSEFPCMYAGTLNVSLNTT